MQPIILMIQFLTRYPLPGKPAFTTENFVAGMKWIPLVGLLLGLPAAALLWLLPNILGLTHQLAAFFAVAATIWATGGLHLDGLADTADGLSSHREAEAALAIMRDSSVGVGGVLAITLDILFKYLCLASLPSSTAVCAVLAAPVIGRMAQVWHAVSAPYARTGPGLGEFVMHLGRGHALAATALGLVALIPAALQLKFDLFPILILFFVMPALASLTTIWFARYLTRRLGGITGDTMGASIELAELLVLFLFSLYGSPIR